MPSPGFTVSSEFFLLPQKDPAEYLLELQRFAEVADPHLRRHAIDMHLR